MEICQTTKFQIHWCLKVTMYRVSQSCSPPAVEHGIHQHQLKQNMETIE